MIEQTNHNANSFISDLESKVTQQMTISSPLYEPNRPKYTPIPTISNPRSQVLALTTKTLINKSLTKCLESITFDTDLPQIILAPYTRLSNAIDIKCDTTSLFPNIRTCSTALGFYHLLIPSDSNSHGYLHAHNNYLSLSNYLFTFFQSSDMVKLKAPFVKSAIQEF